MGILLNSEEKKFLLDSIRTIDDYPKKGIKFYDITTLINNKEAFKLTMDHLEKRYKNFDLDYIAGIDSRGFIFGSILADRLGIGFVPIRKKGKLPAETFCQKYDLEYGCDEIEIHKDAFNNKKDAKILLVDDILVTGGTAACAARLIKETQANIVESCFVLTLEFLNGKDKVEQEVPVYTILSIFE